MKWIANLGMVAALMTARVNAAGAEATRYYVQLVQAGKSNEPMPPGMRPIGMKLKGKLGSAFKSGDYWESKREEISIAPGRPTRVVLNPERSVEIEISGGRRIVTSYYKGRAVERHSGPRGDGMTLIGDNHGGGLWFVVVRRDRPLS